MSICTARGFKATGAAVGIKGGGRLDAALVVSDHSVNCAAVFTQNKAPAAPVQLSKQHLSETQGVVKAVLLTSGNANAATGEPGLNAARTLTHAVATSLSCA